MPSFRSFFDAFARAWRGSASEVDPLPALRAEVARRQQAYYRALDAFQAAAAGHGYGDKEKLKEAMTSARLEYDEARARLGGAEGRH